VGRRPLHHALEMEGKKEDPDGFPRGDGDKEAILPKEEGDAKKKVEMNLEKGPEEGDELKKKVEHDLEEGEELKKKVKHDSEEGEELKKKVKHDSEEGDEPHDKESLLGAHGENLGQFLDSDSFEDHLGDGEELGMFDFDPSEGLTFVVQQGALECFYSKRSEEDDVVGAYVVIAADPKIDLIVKNPAGTIVETQLGQAEGQYQVEEEGTGVYEICFSNANYDDVKLITYVMHTLRSKHPIQKEHVSKLQQFAQHLDIKMGELESEQRLLQMRTNRHIKTEESTNKRVTYYSTLELIMYFVVSIAQVIYIKKLLDVPRHKQRTWA